MKINSEEIMAALAAFRATPDRPEGVFSVAEGCRAVNMSSRSFLDFLHKVKESGRLELVPMTIERLDGKPQRVTGYRIKPAAKLKRA